MFWEGSDFHQIYFNRVFLNKKGLYWEGKNQIELVEKSATIFAMTAYTLIQSSLGYLIVTATKKGISSVRFGEDPKKLENALKKEFGAEELKRDDPSLQKWARALIHYLEGHKPWPKLPYDIPATSFQKRVWNWLRAIPSGKTYHYSEAAKAIGNLKAARAVARACASNPAALVIPCHRIVPKSGGVGGYRWHASRKEKLLKLEQK